MVSCRVVECLLSSANGSVAIDLAIYCPYTPYSAVGDIDGLSNEINASNHPQTVAAQNTSDQVSSMSPKRGALTLQ